ncbi:hypothetical protein IEE94_01915 [Yimella sp. cx-573]|nr:hypothetical protein [Yimella sp. cx-573]
MRAWLRRRLRTGKTEREDGRILILAAGLFAVLGLLVVGAIDVTAIQLAKMRVLNAADSAALTAADSVDKDALYRGGLAERVPLTDGGVTQAASSSLAGQQVPTNVQAWQVVQGSTSGRDTAVVRVQALVRPPITGGFLSFLGSEVSVTVESRARSSVAQ